MLANKNEKNSSDSSIDIAFLSFGRHAHAVEANEKVVNIDFKMYLLKPFIDYFIRRHFLSFLSVTQNRRTIKVTTREGMGSLYFSILTDGKSSIISVRLLCPKKRIRDRLKIHSFPKEDDLIYVITSWSSLVSNLIVFRLLVFPLGNLPTTVYSER